MFQVVRAFIHFNIQSGYVTCLFNKLYIKRGENAKILLTLFLLTVSWKPGQNLCKISSGWFSHLKMYRETNLQRTKNNHKHIKLPREFKSVEIFVIPNQPFKIRVFLNFDLNIFPPKKKSLCVKPSLKRFKRSKYLICPLIVFSFWIDVDYDKRASQKIVTLTLCWPIRSPWQFLADVRLVKFTVWTVLLFRYVYDQGPDLCAYSLLQILINFKNES